MANDKEHDVEHSVDQIEELLKPSWLPQDCNYEWITTSIAGKMTHQCGRPKEDNVHVHICRTCESQEL